MPATSSPQDSPLHSSDAGEQSGVISSRASRAGRELVWLTVAAAFFVVEAVVFFTDLPVSKIFNRRDVQKANNRSQSTH